MGTLLGDPALLSELHRVEEQLQALDEATDSGSYESADQAVDRNRLNARWLELDNEIATAAKAAERAEARASASLPDQPKDFDEWRSEVASWRDRLLDMRAEAETLAEEARSLPEGSARRVKADRRATEARTAAQEEAARLDGWRNAEDLRLSTERFADDVAQKEATRRWLANGARKIQELKDHEAERRRQGLAVWSTEREQQEFAAAMRRPPTPEFVAQVRSELVAANAERAQELDRKAADAMTAASERSKSRATVPGSLLGS